MTNRYMKMMAMSVLAAGLMVAQTPQPAPGQGRHARMGQAGAGMGQRLATLLDLTADQQTQAKQIFQSAAEAARPIAQQMRDARQALMTAVKNGAVDAEIDRLSQNVGDLTAQLTANHTKAFAKFYKILTPEQKQKVDALKGHFMGGGFGPARFGGAAGKARRGPAPQQQQ